MTDWSEVATTEDIGDATIYIIRTILVVQVIATIIICGVIVLTLK